MQDGERHVVYDSAPTVARRIAEAQRDGNRLQPMATDGG
jgi:hypothetical protein